MNYALVDVDGQTITLLGNAPFRDNDGIGRSAAFLTPKVTDAERAAADVYPVEDQTERPDVAFHTGIEASLDFDEAAGKVLRSWTSTLDPVLRQNYYVRLAGAHVTATIEAAASTLVREVMSAHYTRLVSLKANGGVDAGQAAWMAESETWLAWTDALAAHVPTVLGEMVTGGEVALEASAWPVQPPRPNEHDPRIAGGGA